MPEASKNLHAFTDHEKVEPDYFGYYTHEIMELLSQDEDFLPFTSRTSELTKRKCGGVRSVDTIGDSFSNVASTFSNSIGIELSDFKKERLKSLLRQGVFDLTPEVDELLDPVISMCQLQSELRNKRCSSSVIGAASKGDTEQVPRKKLKMSSFSSVSTLDGGFCREGSISNHMDSKPLDATLLEKEMSNFKKNGVGCLCQKSSHWINDPEGPKALCDACRNSYGKERNLHSDSNIGTDKENGEVDDDLQFLLKNKALPVDETVKKYSDDLYAKLEHMERQLEELLNAVVSKCRPMTRTERQELRKLIQMLPQHNLNRVVEIVQHSKLAETRSSVEFFVDLEQEDNLTLWRLYYYVKAVEKARELLM